MGDPKSVQQDNMLLSLPYIPHQPTSSCKSGQRIPTRWQSFTLAISDSSRHQPWFSQLRDFWRMGMKLWSSSSCGQAHLFPNPGPARGRSVQATTTVRKLRPRSRPSIGPQEQALQTKIRIPENRGGPRSKNFKAAASSRKGRVVSEGKGAGVRAKTTGSKH